MAKRENDGKIKVDIIQKGNSFRARRFQTKKINFHVADTLLSLIGTIIFFIISYVGSLLPCDNYNFWTNFYRISCWTVFNDGFFILMSYQILFPYIFRKIIKKKNEKVLNVLVFSVTFIFPSIYQYFHMVGAIHSQF